MKCSHCGLPVPTNLQSPDPALPSFCCDGCNTVYGILHDHNLGKYYDLKEGAASVREQQPALSHGKSFTYLDSEEGLNQFAFGEDQLQMRFFIEGVHCVACLWLIEKLPDIVPNVHEIRLNLGQGECTVTLEKGGRFADVAHQIQAFGYVPHPLQADQSSQDIQQKAYKKQLYRLGVSAVGAGNIMLLSVSLYSGATGNFATLFEWLSAALCFPIIFYSGQPFFKSAWGAIRSRVLNIDIPVSAALLFGYSFSAWSLVNGSEAHYFDSLAMFVFLLLATRIGLLSYHQRQERQHQFLELFLPPTAKKATESGSETVALDSISIGDNIVVEDGDIVPLDGILESEEGVFNCHILTGESQLATLLQGAPVYAGYKHHGDAVTIKVVTEQGQTRLNSILNKLDTLEKPSIVTLADKVAKWFLAVTLLLSVVAFFVLGFESLLALIIIACPCALALATPLSYTVSMNKAIQKGIFIKSPSVLEQLPLTEHILFDKTGTLTTGELSVVSSDIQDSELLTIAAQLESISMHPIARAIVRFAGSSQKSTNLIINDITETPGKGVSGTYNDTRYELRQIQHSDITSQDIRTKVGLYKESQLLGQFELEDTLRPDVQTTLNALKEHASLQLVSGDSEGPVSNVAKLTGIETFHFSKSPEEKQAHISSLQHTVMVGDGINDTLAFKAANVSVAVQGSLEASLQLSDVYMSTHSLDSLVDLFYISKQARRTIITTIAISLTYNIAGIISVWMGWVGPLFAAILMPTSSATVLAITIFGIRGRT
jgi:Cu2+-exporting ATPase/Cu+-exporting ATPase